MTDAAGHITFYNEAAAALWGCRPELGDSKFCGSWKLYRPDGTTLPHDECPMAMALRQKRPIRGMEAVAERPDGTRISFISYPIPLFGTTGRLMGAVNLLVDVSERMRAEQDNQHLAAIVDSSEDAIIGKDLSGIIRSWNPAAERLFGYAREEAIGKSITLVIPPHLWDEEASILDRLADGKRIKDFETIRVRKNGTPVSVSLSISPVRSGRGAVVGVSTIARDITERKLAEQAIAERNTQLQLAGRAALVGSYVYDVRGGTMQISQGYATIHGLPEGTIETTIREWRARVHPEDLARTEGLREQAFARGRKEDNAEYRIVLSNGEVRWIERRGTISYDQMGHPERVVGVNIDVTERKGAEERQRILIAELDHRVKNALATVSSVIVQTAVGSKSVTDFVAALDGRIRSMATTQELLSSGGWQGISLTALIRHELAPYATSDNSKISGPEVLLRPEAGRAMAMVLHELATNAAKYGALSTSTGQVSIQWHLRMNGQPPSYLVLEWQEIGGPPVASTVRPSYGTSTICDLIPYEFHGSVELVKGSDGVCCHLELPSDWLSNASEVVSRSAATANGHEKIDDLSQVGPKALCSNDKLNSEPSTRLGARRREARVLTKKVSDHPKTRHELLARVPKALNTEYRALQRILRAIDSHIVKGEYRLFEHGKRIEKLQGKNNLIAARQLQQNLEKALHLMRSTRERLLKELEQIRNFRAT